MTELVGNWLRFTTQQPKRKRAEAVCFFCHSKKIKCDLQVNIHHSIYFRNRTCRVLTALRDRAEAPRAIRDAPTVTTRTRTAINGRLREASSAAERPLKQSVVPSLELLSRVVSYTPSVALARTTLTTSRGRCGRQHIRTAQCCNHRVWK